MKPHPQDPRIMIMDNIHEGRHLWPLFDSGVIARNAAYQGAVFRSQEITALAESFDPAVNGYAELQDLESNGLQVIYRDVRPDDVDQLQFAGHWSGSVHAECWKKLLLNYADLVRPLFQDRFHVEIRAMKFSKEAFHQDYDEINVVLPLGKNQLSTIWKNSQGQVLAPQPGSLFVGTTEIVHSPPVVTEDRAVLTAYAPYPHPERG